jgi:hypothetical protein
MAKRKKVILPAPAVHPQIFYVHYDFETGNLTSVSNEKLQMHTHSLEITFDEYEQFVLNKNKITDFKVEDGILVCTKVEPKPAQNILQERYNTDSPDLEIYRGNEWKFVLKKEAKNITMFLTLESDRNFLIKTFKLNFKDLNVYDIAFPIETNWETSNDIAFLTDSTLSYDFKG